MTGVTASNRSAVTPDRVQYSGASAPCNHVTPSSREREIGKKGEQREQGGEKQKGYIGSNPVTGVTVTREQPPCDVVSPHSKPIRPGDPLPKRDTACRCFTVAEVAEALDMRPDVVDACIRCGVLPAVEVGCRRLVSAGAVAAFVPERRRQEVRARLDAIASRRGGRG